MKLTHSMSKTTFNGIHIDLSDVSLIGLLTKTDGIWSCPLVWRATGAAINVKMGDIKDKHALFVTGANEAEERYAKDNYDRLVEEWKKS